MSSHPTDSQRAASTRAAIIATFTKLALQRRYDRISVAELTAQAGVGKSTFYEHFGGKDAVLLAAMEPVLLALSTAASGRAARSYVRDMVQHLWDRRSIARPLLASVAGPILHRALAEAIRPHAERADTANPEPRRTSAITANGIAAAQLAMLRCWLAGEATATVDEMTERLIAASKLLTRDLP